MFQPGLASASFFLIISQSFLFVNIKALAIVASAVFPLILLIRQKSYLRVDLIWLVRVDAGLKRLSLKVSG